MRWLSFFLLCIGGGAIIGYSSTYSMSYKEAILLWGIVFVIASIPLGIWLYQWWTDPLNQTGIRRWELEAFKEEVFLAWCQEEKWYAMVKDQDMPDSTMPKKMVAHVQQHFPAFWQGRSDLDLREDYRMGIEWQVRDLMPPEVLQWCQDNLEPKSFWKTAGAVLGTVAAGAVDLATFALLDGEEE